MKNQLVILLLQLKSLMHGVILCVLFTLNSTAFADDTNLVKQGTVGSDIASTQVNEPEVAIAWVDVRSWLEYQIDHIDGDPRVPVSDIVEGVSELYPDKNTPIRLYCAAGVRAGTATNALIAAGYTNVQNAGGIEDVRARRK